jgi:NAD(P)H-dependent FMN reductase
LSDSLAHRYRDTPIHIVAICGSLRGSRSYTRRALAVALDEVQRAGATIDLVDLAELELPLRHGSHDTDDHPGTVELRRRVVAADGVLLGSPEYHNSFSGALKNCLDLLGEDELGGKIFGLLGVGGGESGAINTLGHLRHVVRGVGGWSLPAQVSIPNSSKSFSGDRLVEPRFEDRLRRFARELVRFTRLYKIEPEFEASLMDVIDDSPDERIGR